MDALASVFIWLDYAAVAVFAATGAMAAAQRKHDIVTFGFFAAVTGVGGGTMRDLLLDAPRSRLLLIYPETSRVEAMTWV